MPDAEYSIVLMTEIHFNLDLDKIRIYIQVYSHANLQIIDFAFLASCPTFLEEVI